MSVRSKKQPLNLENTSILFSERLDECFLQTLWLGLVVKFWNETLNGAQAPTVPNP